MSDKRTSMFTDVDLQAYGWGCMTLVAVVGGAFALVISVAGRAGAERQVDHAMAGLAAFLFGATILQTLMVRSMRRQLAEHGTREIAGRRTKISGGIWLASFLGYRLAQELEPGGFLSDTIVPEIFWGVWLGLGVGFVRMTLLWWKHGVAGEPIERSEP